MRKKQGNEYAKAVELMLEKAECRFSDNYFDLPAGQKKRIEVNKKSLTDKLSLEELRAQLRVRSLYDIEER